MSEMTCSESYCGRSSKAVMRFSLRRHGRQRVADWGSQCEVRDYERALLLSRSRAADMERVHPSCELEVKVGETAGIMGRQVDLDDVVDVRPFGVVLHALGN